MLTTKSNDGTIKFQFKEGHSAVLIPMNQKTLDGKDRTPTYTLCISSQIGCAIGCTFCYSAKTKFKKNLSVEELEKQVLTASNYLNIKPNELKSIVFMGMGEPLLNYTNVLEFCKLLNKKHYVSYQKMTISTSGIIPKMKELIKTNLKIKLALSLHSTKQKVRDKLMPNVKQYPIKDLIEVCKDYNKKYKQKIMIEYLMIKDLTDTKEDLENLINYNLGKNSNFNLIPINPTTELKPSNRETILNFKEELRKAGYKCFIRENMGQDIEAACGMLK